MSKPNLLIIGAGFSGLMAAYRLMDSFNITILEASDHIGGRARSIALTTDPEYIIETGAEFVHGELPLTMDLLKRAGIDMIACEGKWYQHANGTLSEEEEQVEGWDELMERMEQQEEDMTLNDFLHRYYFSEKKLTDAVRRFAGGFDLADPDRVSIKSLAKEWAQDEMRNYRVDGGYSRLANWMKKELLSNAVQLYTGQVIQKIEWSDHNVVAFTDTEKYVGEKVIISIPPSAIDKIEFLPTVPLYQQAAADLAIGPVIKGIFLFDQMYWPDDTGFILSEEEIPTWWTQLPSTKPLITAWLGGNAAAALNDKTDEVLIEKALTSLSHILGISFSILRSGLLEAHVFNWTKNKFIEGGYSYDTLLSASAKELLLQPIDQTIFFTGEALYKGSHPGTMEAALVAGEVTASLIRNVNS